MKTNNFANENNAIRVYKTRYVLYRVEKNEDGTLDIFREYVFDNKNKIWERVGAKFANAGSLIVQAGGIDAMLAACEMMNVSDILASNEASEATKVDRKKVEEQERAAIKEEFDRAFAGETTESTIGNIRILLRYLNTQNWGTWNLPSMSIAYQCNQYDCDGKPATTIRLDMPIEFRGQMVSKFQHGAPRGHLNDYTRI